MTGSIIGQSANIAKIKLLPQYLPSEQLTTNLGSSLANQPYFSLFPVGGGPRNERERKKCSRSSHRK